MQTKLNKFLNKLLRKDPKMEPIICYSQNGEDLILNRFLDNKKERERLFSNALKRLINN